MTGEPMPESGKEIARFQEEDVVLEGRIVDGNFPRQGYVRFGPPGTTFEDLMNRRPSRSFTESGFLWTPPPPPQPRRGPSFESFLVDELASIFGHVATAFRTTLDALADLGPVPEEPPRDPRARALWLKQHRGHGPETPKNWRKR